MNPSRPLTLLERFNESKKPKVEAPIVAGSIEMEIAIFEQTGKLEKCLDELHSYLSCIKPTSVDPERAFSTTSLIVTKKRNRIAGKKIAKILFLHDCD